ncbi:MAG TPA: CHC2 zinc finger domain-containing protein [Roseiarcus sp.]|nr:CHC2 zinc finger domain-containing protein [Roseiarcus sp.]
MSGGLPTEAIERARATNILEVARRGTSLKQDSQRWWSGPCPNCGGTDRFIVNTIKRRFSCRGCEARGDVIALVRHIEGCSFPEAVERLTGGRWRPSRGREPFICGNGSDAAPEAPDDANRNLGPARRIASSIIPPIGTPGAAYLRDVRKIDVAAIEDILWRTDAIGWHPSVYFNAQEYPRRGDPPHPLHGQRLGCIIGIMSDATTAEPTGAISRTYLAPDGTKVGKAKTLGAPRGIIRLSPDDTVEGGLFIAEGLETALSGMAIGLRPMWACGDCGLMASFPYLVRRRIADRHRRQ